MKKIEEIGENAKSVSYFLSQVSSTAKNFALLLAAKNLRKSSVQILDANKQDVANAKENGLKGSILDRLMLSSERINDMASGLENISNLEDPIGEIVSMNTRPNGLQIGQRRVPLGVVGIIYEARPNVTSDVFGLCIKTGNACILRGGKEAFLSNMAIVTILRRSLIEAGLPEDSVQLVEDTTRESAMALMKLNKYLDILIPRGGAGLIKTVVENSTVPVIETGVGNCHIYIDSSADPNKAINITYNAKTHRPGVCNAAESLLIHSSVAKVLLPLIGEKLREKNVEEDWGTEYLDYIISVKVVNSISEAITHINKYGTNHSESIVTEDYSNAQQFLNQVDAAAVYVNASTRFTDGFEFGFGAEIGISTQKLHARGPMGLKALTSTKYIIYGDGQIRQ